MTTRTRRRGIFVLFSALVMLLLGGCMRIEMDLTLHENDTVDGVMVMAISDQVAEMLGTDPESLWDEAGTDLENGLPPGSTQEPYAADGYTGTRVTFTGVALQDMAGTGEVDSLTITREGDEFVVTGAMDLTDTGAMTGTEDMMEGFAVRVAVTFPGTVSEHNGSLDGRTVTWEPALGERTEMNARGSAVVGGGGGAGWLPILLGVLGAAAVAAVVIVALRRKKERAADAHQQWAQQQWEQQQYAQPGYYQPGNPQPGPGAQPWGQPTAPPFPPPPTQPYPQQDGPPQGTPPQGTPPEGTS